MTYENNNVHGKWKESHIYENPTFKMDSYGQENLSDTELVGLILRSGTKSASVEIISQKVVAMLSSGKRTVNDLASIEGVGTKKAMMIIASLELGRRFSSKTNDVVTTPKDVYGYIKHHAFKSEQERFLIVSLNGAHEIIDVIVVTLGLVNRTLIHPREIFSKPIMQRATSIVLAHNHPSGVLEPSEADISTTERIVQCGVLLGIKVIDHIIFNSQNYYSFLEHCLL